MDEDEAPLICECCFGPLGSVTRNAVNFDFTFNVCNVCQGQSQQVEDHYEQIKISREEERLLSCDISPDTLLQCFRCLKKEPESKLRVCIYCVNEREEAVLVTTGNYKICNEEETLKRLMCSHCRDHTPCEGKLNRGWEHRTILYEDLKLLTEFDCELYVIMSRHEKMDMETSHPVLNELREEYLCCSRDSEKEQVLRKVEDFVSISRKRLHRREIVDCELITLD